MATFGGITEMKPPWKIIWRIADAAYYLSLVGTPLLVAVSVFPVLSGDATVPTRVVLARCAMDATLGAATFAIAVVVARVAWRKATHET